MGPTPTPTKTPEKRVFIKDGEDAKVYTKRELTKTDINRIRRRYSINAQGARAWPRPTLKAFQQVSFEVMDGTGRVIVGEVLTVKPDGRVRASLATFNGVKPRQFLAFEDQLFEVVWAAAELVGLKFHAGLHAKAVKLEVEKVLREERAKPWTDKQVSAALNKPEPTKALAEAFKKVLPTPSQIRRRQQKANRLLGRAMRKAPIGSIGAAIR